MNPQPEKKSPSKISWLSDNLLIENLKKLFRKFKATTPSSQPDKDSIPLKGSESAKPGEEVSGEASKEESEKEEKITNDNDCDDKSVELDHILEMVAPALDRNPRRMKQFFNLFRFQRTIGKRTALFSYDPGTSPEKMWNCRKLAKFVAISMRWPELVSALGSNSKLLDQLQEYALKPESENKNLEKWTKHEKLIGLLRYGCEGSDPLKKPEDYTLSGLDFSKLLQISPVVPSSEEGTDFSSITFDGIEFVRIPAGDFMMGSNEYEDEQPVHNVKIGTPFYLGKYPVTQKQWEEVMGNNPSSFKGADLPVESVSWDDVQEFIKRLNEREGTDKYRLPSEAEWEYACRAGTNTKYSFGDDESKLGDYAWYSGYSIYEEWVKNNDKILKEGRTHPVGQKKPNAWGLYDMHGNVWEWVQDRWHGNYEGAPSDGSAWEDGDSSSRVVRGGGWYDGAGDCRSAARAGFDPGARSSNFVGFRLLRKL
jgi:formylglycine-generating enzyme required for sulfatase activity